MHIKKVFSVLLVANIVFAITVNFRSYEATPAAQGKHFEKIVLLPATVACLVWGNFSPDTAQRADAALKQLDIVRYKTVPAAAIVKYWVHTSAFENRQNAEREINKLRNMGIISFRVQETEEWLNAISFGEFKNRVTAQKLLEQLEAKTDSEIMISERKMEQLSYLIFDTDIQKIGELYLLAEQFPDGNLEHSACERL